MSAVPWIEDKHSFATPDPDGKKSEPQAGEVWRELSLPLSLPQSQVAALCRIAGRISPEDPRAAASVVTVFTGPDAAGKLMAAEALAYELQRPLHRADAGEPGLAEKPHFSRTLEAAETENAILLLENADHAPGCLIQKLKSYPGLSILISDSGQTVPTRLRAVAHSVVDFPFPSENE
jgi:hypothetical protein